MQYYGLNQCWCVINTNSEMYVKKQRSNNNQDIPAEENQTPRLPKVILVNLMQCLFRSIDGQTNETELRARNEPIHRNAISSGSQYQLMGSRWFSSMRKRWSWVLSSHHMPTSTAFGLEKLKSMSICSCNRKSLLIKAVKEYIK